MKKISIQMCNPATATMQDWIELTALLNTIDHEALPDHPPTSKHRVKQDWKMPYPNAERYLWVARHAESGIVARATIWINHSGANEHMAHFSIAVLPEFRRRSIATRLLEQVVVAAQNENRRLLISGTYEHVTGGKEFLQRVGATWGRTMKESRLTLSEVNHDLLQTWITRGRERAAEYELGFWQGPYPEDQLEAVAFMKTAMNTAPRGDLDLGDWRVTPEQLRQRDAIMQKRGNERWTVYVRHAASRIIAGYSELWFAAEHQHSVHQGDTAVMPEHRNAGLGRWLKAAMLLKLLEERPQVEHIYTGNADSNAPMLKINYELGFKPYTVYTDWQVPTAIIAQHYLTEASTSAANESEKDYATSRLTGQEV